MRKKVLPMVLASLLMVVLFALAGCGGTAGNKTGETQKTEEQNNTAQTKQDQNTITSNPWADAVQVGSLTPPAKANKQYTIGVLIPNLRDPYWVAQAYGFFDEAEKYGAKVTLLDAGGYANIDKQVNQINDLVVRKVDAIALAAVSAQGTANAVDEAVKAGIPVLNMVTMTDSKNVKVRVAPADWDLGAVQAEFIGEKLGGKGKVVMLNGPAGATWSMTRYAGFKATLKEKYPEIKILGDRWTEMDRAVALNTMEDFLQRFPDLNAVYTPSDLIGCGAADAVKAAGKKGQIIVTTGSYSRESDAFVKDGLIQMAAGEQTVLIGRWTTRAAIGILNGDSWPSIIQQPLQKITLENISKFDSATEFSPVGWSVPR